VNINDIRDYDISAKNPANIKQIIHQTPQEILSKIEQTNQQLVSLTKKLSKLY
jgi:type I restriction enzyme M protein